MAPDFWAKWAKIGQFSPSIIRKARNSAVATTTPILLLRAETPMSPKKLPISARRNAIFAPTHEGWILDTPKSSY